MKGGTSARNPLNERFPREHGEAMTAAGLCVRRLAGRAVGADPLDEKQVRLLLATPPRWDPEALCVDEYYWYYGAQALALVGGRHASAWDEALFAVARAQSGNTEHRGSWDPVGVWSYCGGRVMTTALIALALEAPFRHALPDEPGGNRKKR